MKKIVKIFAISLASLYPLWSKRYVNPRIDDGGQWSMMRVSGNKEKYTYGSNKSPITMTFVTNKMESLYTRE